MTIWKFEVPVADGRIVLDMPRKAQCLDLQMQNGTPCVWALVDPEAPLQRRSFVWVGTGHAVPEHWSGYIGTVQMHDGALVLHLFSVYGASA